MDILKYHNGKPCGSGKKRKKRGGKKKK